MSTPAEDSVPRQQLLKYAEDLSRLYAEANRGRQQMARVVEMSLELSRCVSAEEVAARLASVARELAGWPTAGVYALRGGKLQLLAQHPHDAGLGRVLEVRAEELSGLTGQVNAVDGPAWLKAAGGPALALALPGRQKGGTSCLLGGRPAQQPPARGFSPEAALTLLAAHAGMLLENFRYEERLSGGLSGDQGAGPQAAGIEGLLGDSPAMRGLGSTITRLARVDSSVLIRGETGTGKSRVARAIHEASPRAGKAFVAVNCGAIPDSLIESELFGHEAGAFTGAQKRHRGKIEQSHGGTLFLDEVGELSLPAQAKLLTVLEERRFTRVGGEAEVQADVRIVAATNADLEAACAANRFRRDLLFRLDVVPLHVPPLRERGRDALLIAHAVAREVASKYSLPTPRFDPEAEARLLAYAWPGNVRELRNVVERAVVLSPDGSIGAAFLPAGADRGASPAPSAGSSAPAPHEAEHGDGDGDGEADGGAEDPGGDGLPAFSQAKEAMIERWEADYFRQLLASTRGNVAAAARQARMDKKHLHRKIEQLGLDLEALRRGE